MSELPAVVSIIAVTSGMGGVGPCLLGWTQFHLQPYLLSLSCPDMLQWRRRICWLSFDRLFFWLDSPVSCFLSDREQHQKHLFGEGGLCCSEREEPHCQEHQTSLPKPPSAQIARRMAMSSCCTSCSINTMAICCQVLPAFMSYANHSCKRPSILGSSWMEVAAEMHFSVFTPL